MLQPEKVTPAQPAPVSAVTIKQYCQHEKISRNAFYKRRRRGNIPPLIYDDRGRIMVHVSTEGEK
jgi:hypothetical protein